MVSWSSRTSFSGGPHAVMVSRLFSSHSLRISLIHFEQCQYSMSVQVLAKGANLPGPLSCTTSISGSVNHNTSIGNKSLVHIEPFDFPVFYYLQGNVL